MAQLSASLRITQHPAKPLVVFDGDCGFCRFWIERLRRMTGRRVQYEPFQTAAERLTEIPPKAFQEAVQMVDPDGAVYAGADAAFRLLQQTETGVWLAWLVIGIPGLLAFSRVAYRFIARNRTFFSWLTRLGWGRDTRPSSYAASRRLFAHGLGLIFFCAFASFTLQLPGLIGSHGIQPAGEMLQAARHQLGGGAFFELPTIFWINASDGALMTGGMIGIGLSLIMACGLCPGLCALLLWGLFLSFCAIGSPFLNYQWEALLLETALPAALFLPWRLGTPWAVTTRLSTLGRWLLKWLIFRLMLESAIVKLSSGDPNWRNLTAMSYHYETQPLPLPTAWLLNQAPLWYHKFEVLLTFAIEFLAPIGLLGPRRLRHAAAFAMILLMCFIAGTGNYAYFDYLAMLLCVPLLDDTLFPDSWRRKLLGRTRPPVHFSEKTTASWICEPLAALSVFCTGILLLSTFSKAPEGLLELTRTVIGPTRSFNAYGLFAVMTTDRPEIIIEGSNDGRTWLPYEFPYKPGNRWKAPRLAAPFQPRLDWQLWFEALDAERTLAAGQHVAHMWFITFLQRLLDGTPEVLKLLEWNPFPVHPPKYVRAVLYRYHFTHFGEGGAWWNREELGIYVPPQTAGGR